MASTAGARVTLVEIDRCGIAGRVNEDSCEEAIESWSSLVEMVMLRLTESGLVTAAAVLGDDPPLCNEAGVEGERPAGLVGEVATPSW